MAKPKPTAKKAKKTKAKKTKTKTKMPAKLRFDESHYRAGDGMMTSVWGPSMWHYLHTISFNYPVEPTETQKAKYRELIMNMKHTLPCRHCRENLVKNLKMCPLTAAALKNRDAFSRFVYNLHETVNTMLCKRSGLTYEEVRDRYEHFRARCPTAAKMSKNKTRKHKKSLSKKQNQTRRVKESGCTDPLRGTRAKCVIKIVPKTKKCKTFQMNL